MFTIVGSLGVIKIKLILSTKKTFKSDLFDRLLSKNIQVPVRLRLLRYNINRWVSRTLVSHHTIFSNSIILFFRCQLRKNGGSSHFCK